MPKIKMPKANPSLDMTPMVDLAFLLVTFFMLTASVRVTEPVIVDAPASTSEKILPDNVILISVDKKGKAFYNITSADVRIRTLERMADQYTITFTDKEKKEFAKMTSIGVPISKLKDYINMPEEQKAKYNSPGIPMDSTDNQLSYWIRFGHIEAKTKEKAEKDRAKGLGRESKYEPVRFAIKADAGANFIKVREVIKTFTDQDIYLFNLITNLEEAEKI